MIKNLVSIIMLAHGRMQFVEESVRSVLAQTYTKWELLCVDDSQGYEVVRLLQDLKGKDSRIHVYHSVAQEGAGNDRNSVLMDAYELMLEISKGADCYLLPECLAKSRKLGRPNIFTKLLWQYRVLCYAEHVNPVVAQWRNIQYLWYGGVKRIKFSQKV